MQCIVVKSDEFENSSPLYIFPLNPDYVAARSLRSLRSNYLPKGAFQDNVREKRWPDEGLAVLVKKQGIFSLTKNCSPPNILDGFFEVLTIGKWKNRSHQDIWLLVDRFFCKTNNIWHIANRALEEPVSINGGKLPYYRKLTLNEIKVLEINAT